MRSAHAAPAKWTMRSRSPFGATAVAAGPSGRGARHVDEDQTLRLPIDLAIESMATLAQDVGTVSARSSARISSSRSRDARWINEPCRQAEVQHSISRALISTKVMSPCSATNTGREWKERSRPIVYMPLD